MSRPLWTYTQYQPSQHFSESQMKKHFVCTYLVHLKVNSKLVQCYTAKFGQRFKRSPGMSSKVVSTGSSFSCRLLSWPQAIICHCLALPLHPVLSHQPTSYTSFTVATYCSSSWPLACQLQPQHLSLYVYQSISVSGFFFIYFWNLHWYTMSCIMTGCC